MLQNSAVALETSFCVSLKEYVPVANGKQQKLKTITWIVRSSGFFSFYFFFFLSGNEKTRKQFHTFIKELAELFGICLPLKSQTFIIVGTSKTKLKLFGLSCNTPLQLSPHSMEQFILFCFHSICPSFFQCSFHYYLRTSYRCAWH